MNAAKAKAAAKHAKGKAAAAAASAAAASTTTTPSVPTPTPAPRSRPSVTQYWGDSASSTPAPGGGIQRIGYDQARFEQAVKEVIIEPEPAPGKEGEEESVKAKVEVRKEDVALLVKELEMSAKEAEELLRSVGGSLEEALLEATGA